MIKTKKPDLVSNQQGMVAIVVTTVLMLVISLIVLGYAQSIRNEQRQALDDQLSTQAFYAAESGVNLAKNKINAILASSQYTYTQPILKTECKGTKIGINEADYKIDDSTDSSITCLLVNDELPAQEFSEVGANAKVTRVYSSASFSGVPEDKIDSITFKWESSKDKSLSNCNGSTSLEASRSCKQPILRVDIVPINVTGLTQTSLQDSQMTTFLSPGGSIPSQPFNANAKGGSPSIQPATCSASASDKLCTFTITGLRSSTAGYGIRLVSLYGTSNISINASSTKGAVQIKGQYLIDSTAKAVDVTRRIQVRISGTASDAVTFAASGGGSSGSSGGAGICKLYKISAGVVDDGCQ